LNPGTDAPFAETPHRDPAGPDARIAGETNFDRSGVVAGSRQALPLAISVGAYGLVFGVLARQAGLSALEAALMSALVFAGSAQFVVVSLWASPLPIATLILTTLVVNARHVLMGAVMRPILDGMARPLAYLSVFLMSDESWALTMGEAAKGRGKSSFFVGCGLTIYVAWLSATLVGNLAGGAVDDPTKWGFDFAFNAVFIALLVRLWRGAGDLLPWLMAATVALLSAHLLPGKWYILLGGLAGFVVGVWRYDD
jgi:4-azaleucine resistance transporter AzlC